MSTALKTSSQKTVSRFTWGRYILIVGAALLLAILLYAALNVSDSGEGSETESSSIESPETETTIGVQPASFQEISEFTEGGLQRLRLSGKAEPGAVVVITNRGERLRQVGVNDLGQWGVVLDVQPEEGMALEAQLYMGEDSPGILSEETVFRIPLPNTKDGSAAELEEEGIAFPNYKTSALIMVTAPGSPSRVIQSPYGGAPTSGPLSLSVIDYDFLGGVIITGTSSVPGRVRIYAQDAVIAETGIGVGGRWSSIAGRMLSRARGTLRVELIPAPGVPNAPNTPISISVPFNFLPPLQGEDTDDGGSLFVNRNAFQWQVRRTLIGGGGQTTIIFAPEIVE